MLQTKLLENACFSDKERKQTKQCRDRQYWRRIKSSALNVGNRAVCSTPALPHNFQKINNYCSSQICSQKINSSFEDITYNHRKCQLKWT